MLGADEFSLRRCVFLLETLEVTSCGRHQIPWALELAGGLVVANARGSKGMAFRFRRRASHIVCMTSSARWELTLLVWLGVGSCFRYGLGCEALSVVLACPSASALAC